MPFTPDQMVMDFISVLKKGNGGIITIGYRPESGTEEAKTPARWEMTCLTGGPVGSDSIKTGAVGATFEEAMEKFLVNMDERLK